MCAANRNHALLAVRLDAVGPTRLPRLLHDAGFRVTLFSPPYLAATCSRYVERHVPAPVDPLLFTEKLRCHLLEHGTAYQWIQTGDETVVRSIAARYQEEWTGICLPVPRTPLHITLITNKLAFLALAQRAGLPIPELGVAVAPEELADIAEQVGYPLMLKRSEGMAGSGVRHVASPADLSELNWTVTEEQPLMIQEHISGPIGSTEVLFNHGRPLAWVNSYHREFWPTPFAASCVRELVDVPETEEILNQVGAMTGYHGFAGVDWLLDRNDGDGRIHLIELNPRPTPCYHLGPRAGIDFAAALHGMLRGHPRVQRPRVPVTGRALVYQFPQYCYRAIDDRAPTRVWRVASDVPWDDPLLVAALIRRVLTHYLPSNLRERLRCLLRSSD